MWPQSDPHNPIVYEDFQPKSEWKREEGANILLLQLPGFSKEQITYEQSNRIIRVFGQRPIGNNRWRRFNQAFGLPENCKTNKIYSSVENENFKIIMPKESVIEVGPKQAAKVAQETSIPPKAAREEQGKEKSVSTQIPQKDTVEPVAQKGQKGAYEDFEPKSEWKREEGANILILQLPGFSKEQITYEQSNRTIRVFGERPIGNNIWRRFNQAFGLPEYCKTDKIYSNFENENFKIIMPKENVTQVGPKQAANVAQVTPFPPKVVREEERKEKSAFSQIPQKDTAESMAQKGEKGHDENLSHADSTKIIMKLTDIEKNEKKKISEANTKQKKAENVEKKTQVIENKEEKCDLKDTANSMAQTGEKGHTETPPQVDSTKSKQADNKKDEKKKGEANRKPTGSIKQEKSDNSASNVKKKGKGDAKVDGKRQDKTPPKVASPTSDKKQTDKKSPVPEKKSKSGRCSVL